MACDKDTEGGGGGPSKPLTRRGYMGRMIFFFFDANSIGRTGDGAGAGGKLGASMEGNARGAGSGGGGGGGTGDG